MKGRISTQLWWLTALMTLITLIVGFTSFYAASYFELVQIKERMPPTVRAELDALIASGREDSNRYYEIYTRYTDNSLQSYDLAALGAILLISTAFGGAIAFFVSRRISRPITAVANAAAQVSQGHLDVRVAWSGSGELGELVNSFNKMAQDIDSYERERTVLTAGIAHELRTPLTILKGRLHGLIDGVIDPRAGEADRLLRQVEHLMRLVDDLRTLAHADAGELQLDIRTIDLADTVRSQLADMRGEAEAAAISLVPKLQTAIVRGDSVRIAQIIINLVTNALKHGPPGSVVDVVTISDDRSCRIVVEDRGPGFPEQDRAKLFMPFWRAGANKTAGRPGSGMGLALAAKLAEAHGGLITAANRADGGGASFALVLPRPETRQ